MNPDSASLIWVIETGRILTARWADADQRETLTTRASAHTSPRRREHRLARIERYSIPARTARRQGATAWAPDVSTHLPSPSGVGTASAPGTWLGIST